MIIKIKKILVIALMKYVSSIPTKAKGSHRGEGLGVLVVGFNSVDIFTTKSYHKNKMNINNV